MVRTVSGTEGPCTASLPGRCLALGLPGNFLGLTGHHSRGRAGAAPGSGSGPRLWVATLGISVSPSQVSEGLSLESHQLHRTRVGSRWERAGAVKWTSRTSARETTVPAQTSTAWCPRMICSSHPRVQDHRDSGGQGWGIAPLLSRTTTPASSPGTLGKRLWPQGCLPVPENKVLLDSAWTSVSSHVAEGFSSASLCGSLSPPPLPLISPPHKSPNLPSLHPPS